MSTDYNLYEDFQEKPLRKTLVDRLTDEIEKNLNNEQYSVDSLAQSVGMSRSSLHRKLKNILGISTSQFIREYRLKKAFIILKEEDITASEASYRVGFSSATYFSTSFHKFYGFTPGEVKSHLFIKKIQLEIHILTKPTIYFLLIQKILHPIIVEKKICNGSVFFNNDYFNYYCFPNIFKRKSITYCENNQSKIDCCTTL